MPPVHVALLLLLAAALAAHADDATRVGTTLTVAANASEMLDSVTPASNETTGNVTADNIATVNSAKAAAVNGEDEGEGEDEDEDEGEGEGGDVTRAPAAPQDRARNASERFSTTTTLTVDVKDEDDLEPSFIYQGCTLLHGACVNPEYRATVSSGALAGVLAVRPDRIQAVDMDSLAAPVRYSFLSGSPASYADYFAIDPASGAVRQVRAVDTAVAKSFDIIVKAEEDTATRRFATAKLVITVKPVDTSPPVIAASALEGFVDENAPKGTRVLDGDGAPLTLTVSDADLGPDDPKPGYSWELTTPSFAVDASGALVVNEERLDRDPPSPGKFRFQVVARGRRGVGAAVAGRRRSRPP